MMMEGEESDEKPTNCEDAEHDKEDDTMELRVFRVVIHLRSFKASMLLPRRSVNAYVRLLLPSQIVQLAVASSQASSKLTTPLRTHPPVPVDRGTEVNIPNGWGGQTEGAKEKSTQENNPELMMYMLGGGWNDWILVQLCCSGAPCLSTCNGSNAEAAT